MKKLFSTLFVVFFATSLMAQTGLTCEDPIPVDENYTGIVTEPCELWYVANTYDLPLHVYFSPFADNSTWGPEVQIDFTCTPGVYDDPKVDSLINTIADFDVTFPVEFMCDLVVRDGKNEWDLSIDKSYRERMAEFGITYNIQALVKVTYFEGGEISLKPDSLFKNCMESSEMINLGDTLDILPNDTNRTFIISYADWQNDSIRFVWTGEEAARVWMAKTMCDFEPSLIDPFVWNYIDVTQDQPYKLYTEQMKADIKEHSGGLFYGKIMSPVAGKLVVERIPKSKPKGDAELLEYGKQITVSANDANALYCFPKNWTSTEFVATSNHSVEMYVSNQADFSFDGTNVLTTCSFDTEGSEKVLYLSTKEIADFAAQASDDYIYVRFKSATTISIMPNAWDALACLDYSVQIDANVEEYIPNNTNAVIYRFRYDDFSGYDMTIKWNGNGILPVYLSDTCSFELSANDPHVLLYKNIARRGSHVVSAATLEEWASRVGKEGYLYARFNPSVSSRVTFQTDKPEDVDPEIPDPIYTTITAAICFGDTYEWNGQTYTESGEYTYTTVAANGADSIVTLTLTVYPQTETTTEEVTVGYGETYEWHGVVYAESGEYTITLQDENGCDYQATLILTVEEEPVSPCVAASTLLEPVAELTLNLGNAFDIYRIDYQAWLASGVNLVWTGKGALHTFVAKDCEFAVAIYHKDVVNYTEVPAEGNVILSKAILAPLAQYVDADGYLYVRFLTELEGQLTTALAE